MIAHALSRWRDETGDAGALGLVRIGLGILLFRQAFLAARTLVTDGYYFGDVFHLPFVPPSFVPSRSAYVAVLCAQLSLAVAIVIGRQARSALLLASLLGTWIALADRLQLHNNLWALLCFSFLLSFSPCDRVYVWRRARDERPSPEGPLWAQRLMQWQLSLVYLASGGSKLLDRDWRTGRVIGDRLVRYGYRDAPEMLHGLVDFLVQPGVAGTIAGAAIATELFLAFGLLFRRTRIAALWLGISFHLAIEITSKVQIFTWLTLTLYALHATPDHHARKLIYDATTSRGRALARLVRAFDWLGRFEPCPAETDAMPAGASIVIVDRSGVRHRGLAATTAIARAVPPLFLAWPLLAAITRASGADTEKTTPPRPR